MNTSKALISMSVPISLGMLSTFLFQIIDTYFVGQLGSEALAALSFSSTVYFLLVGVFMGLAVGVSIVVGSSHGGGDVAKVKSSVLVGVTLSLLFSILLGLIITGAIESFFGVLGAEEALMPLIQEYMITLLFGFPLLTFGLTSGAILRAVGVVKPPEIIMGIAGIINLVLDYLLIFGHFGFPQLGIKGAALATVLSWVFVAIAMLVLLLKKGLISIKGDRKNPLIKITKEIGKLSLPTITSQAVGPLTLMFITMLLAKESTLAVAAYGVVGRIEMLLTIGILAVSTASTPFIAQRVGAKDVEGIEQAIAFGGRASTYLGIVVAVFICALIYPIAGLFSEDGRIIDYAAIYFYFVAPSYVAYGLYLITSSIFNGLALPINSLRIVLVKSFLLTIPLALIGSFWGVTGVFASISIGNLAAGFYASYEMKKEFIRINSPLAKVNVWNEYLKDIKFFLRNKEQK